MAVAVGVRVIIHEGQAIVDCPVTVVVVAVTELERPGIGRIIRVVAVLRVGGVALGQGTGDRRVFRVAVAIRIVVGVEHGAVDRVVVGYAVTIIVDLVALLLFVRIPGRVAVIAIPGVRRKAVTILV